MIIGGDVNYFAVFVSAIISFIVGWLWYGPIFGNTWAKEMGFDMEKMKKDESMKKKMGKMMLLNFIGTLIMVYVLANFVLDSASSYNDVFALVFWIWLGFFASTTLLGGVLWENKSWKLFALNASYWFVNLLVASLILFVWR